MADLQTAEAASRNSSIVVGRDALGNVFVTGDSNTVEVKLTVVVADKRLQASMPGSSALQNPYRGLDAFRETDSALFFGRDDLKTRLWTKFHALQRGRAPRLLPILGASGSGKSSLVRAGLLPELVRQPMEGMRNPTVVVLRPGADPLQRLADVLGQLMPLNGTVLAARATSSPDLVHGAVRSADADHRVVIFVDQLEELFTECTAEAARDAFLATLAHAAAQPDGLVSVIFAMRNDFAGSLRTYEAFATAVREHPFRVSQMSMEQLIEAIAQPAHVLRHPWPIGLVENLVLQCEGRTGALPLLQFALKRLWSEHVAGRLSDSWWSSRLIEDFVVQVAETLYEGSGAGRAREAHQRIIRRAFVAMVQLGEGAADTRRVARLSEIVARRETHDEVRAVLAPFASPEARLVTVSESDGESTYELAHEALIASWDRLRAWLGHVPSQTEAEAVRGELRLRRRLRYAAEAWRVDRSALMRPPELKLVRSLREREPEDLSTLEHAFINASTHAWDAQDRWRRRARALGVIALALMAILGLVALHQSAEAHRETKEAERQKTEAEKQKAEAERQETEAVRQRLEAERQRAEAVRNANIARERLAASYQEQGRSKQLDGELPAARRLLEQALESNLSDYGEDDPKVVSVRVNLAAVLRESGKLPAARQLLDQALASTVRVYGEHHPSVVTVRSNLAMVLRDLGELPAARQQLEQALASAVMLFGEHNPRVATLRNNLALVLHDLGELPAANKPAR